MKPATRYARHTLGCSLDDDGGAGVAQGERSDLLAHDVADMLGRVLAELGDVLAAHHHPAVDLAAPDAVRDTKTPVSIPAQALEMSKVVAFVRPDLLGDGEAHRGSSHWVSPSRYLVMLQLTSTSMSSRTVSGTGEAVGRRRGRRGSVNPRFPARPDARGSRSGARGRCGCGGGSTP